jgi:hypothetical protein
MVIRAHAFKVGCLLLCVLKQLLPWLQQAQVRCALRAWMCINDGEGGWQVYGKVRVEADRVDVEERNQRSACMGGQPCK